MRWHNIKKRRSLNNEKLLDQREQKSDVFKQVTVLKSCFIYALFKRKSQSIFGSCDINEQRIIREGAS